MWADSTDLNRSRKMHKVVKIWTEAAEWKEERGSESCKKEGIDAEIAPIGVNARVERGR